MRLMTRRGPDDEGLWADASCALGFRRLAILDLSSTGHQPMCSEDGRYVLVFNGEIYNYRELQAQLSSQGASFRSTSDTEVVLYALANWGVGALERFNGMFALAFYDATEQSLLLARDHAGIKPLYYLHTEAGLAFASQFNQLVQHPWAVGLGISPDALGLYLRFGYIPAPYALLARTYQLEAGCWVRIDAHGTLNHGRFFNLPNYVEPTLRGAQALEAVSEVVSRAVARHMVSDVPVGVFLSGGIDSPLVAAEAARLAPGIKAFTIGVAGSIDDESYEAARYATALGVDQITRNFAPDDVIGLLDDVLEACSEPSADYSIFPTLMVSRLAREHVTVALSGDGGDELFWGYPGRFAITLEQAPYFALPQSFRYGAVAARKLFGWGKATREALSWPDIGSLYQKKHTLLAEADLRACIPDLPALPGTFRLFSYRGTDLDSTAQWLRWNEFNLHLAGILQKVDRASMHHSLEVRVPLLDREVIDVALRTDWRSCLDVERRIGKLPLRKALMQHTKYQTTAKKGFTVPMHNWLTAPLRDMLHDQVLSRRELLGVKLDQTHLRRIVRDLEQGNRTRARGLWLLLSLALWQDRYLGNSVSPQTLR